MNTNCFSQTLVKNNAGDTSICFTISESKTILKQINKANYLDSLTKIQRTEIGELKVKVRLSELTIKEKSSIISNQDKIIDANNTQLKQKDLEIKNKDSLIVKEKIKKWIAITTGAITTSFMTYLWLAY